MPDPLLLTAGSRDEPEGSPSEAAPGAAPLDASSQLDESHPEANASEPVAPTELGRVLDPSARDAAPGARALLRMEVPPSWLERGGTVRLAVPDRLVCGRCEGGGCESCENRGGLRLGGEPRNLEVIIAPGPRIPKRLRVEMPFGESSPVRQILIDLVPVSGAEPAHATFEPTEVALAIGPAAAVDLRADRGRRSNGPMLVAVALVVIALLLAVVLGSR